ncbi:threonine-phosphate decarboxylase CobD [Pseudanabaena sp. PCC 6802]|uniref:threonine-phosphate decarboxylase CobD n=1 Tax=Pseudanabaena sp. PCC 6802 TaxID=118173 RepID=UPI000346B944|nr:threonine-phosphate decarboxylase CobD [Pseudanabaena sp. PCC 6802]
MEQKHLSSYQPSHGGNVEWAAAIAGCMPSEILDFSASINPLGMPASVRQVLQSPHILAQIHHYPDPNYTRLRQAIANYHQISPDWIMPGNGAAELLTWACRDLAVLDLVRLPVPAFADYLRALRAASANFEKIPLEIGNEMEDRGGSNRQSNRQSIGILLNNPHNPTGRLYQRHQFIPLLEHYDLVVIDEAFMDFLPPSESQSAIDLVEQHPNLVILRSLTKFYALPGLRIGYALAHPDRLRAWQTWRDPWSVNCLAMEAAIAALADREFQSKTWQWLPTARTYLYKQLERIPSISPMTGAANFLLVRSERPVLPLRDRLLSEHRILIRDCQSFPELGDRYFRLSIRTIEEQEKLLQGITLNAT